MVAVGAVEIAYFIVAVAVLVILEIIAGTDRPLPNLREFAILEGIKEAAGRCVEMDRPLLFMPGNAPTFGRDRAAMYVNSLNYLKYVVTICADVGAKPIVTRVGAQMFAHVDAIMEEAYRAAGKPEEYDRSSMLRYVGGSSGGELKTIYGREAPGATINIGCEVGEAYEIFPIQKQIGGITAGGTPRYTMMNSYVTGCDYLLIGDEFYGCSAKLSEDRHMVASIVGQDILKWLSIVIAFIVAVAVAAVGMGPVDTFLGL